MSSDLIHALVDIERERAHTKHAETSMRSQPWDADRRVSILTEELGEVARALNDYAHGIFTDDEARRQLRHELIQVAAMATDWIVDIDGVGDDHA